MLGERGVRWSGGGWWLMGFWIDFVGDWWVGLMVLETLLRLKTRGCLRVGTSVLLDSICLHLYYWSMGGHLQVYNCSKPVPLPLKLD